MRTFSVMVGNKDFLINPSQRMIQVYKTDEFGHMDHPTNAEKPEIKKALLKGAKNGLYTWSNAAEWGSNLRPTHTYGVWSI